MKGEIRIYGLDESVLKEELSSTIAETGGCKKQEVKIGDIRKMANGLGTVWIQCPLYAARVVDKGKLRVGWTMVRTEMLKARPIQCYKC